MSRTWYGNMSNRLEENRMFCDEIVVGTGVTEYMYSDRHPYEVVEVTDQKHIKVRALDHKHIGDGSMDNNWELMSNENNPVLELTRRGRYWYWTVKITSDILENDNIEAKLFLVQNNVDIDKLREKGKVTKYHRTNISIGVADYYHDYSF